MFKNAGEGEEWPAATLTLELLSSREKMALIEGLPGPDADGAPEGVVLPPSVLGSRARLLREAADLERLGLIERVDGALRRTLAADELLAVRTLLEEWAWGVRRPDSQAGELPAGPELAAMVSKIWNAEILISLALQPAGVSDLAENLAGPSLSTVKRHVARALNAGLLEKGARVGLPGGYALTQKACLLIRTLCGALRLEERHLGKYALPPTGKTLRAGMAVMAQILSVERGVDREVLFAVLSDIGGPIAVKRARYSDGRLVYLKSSNYHQHLLSISGTIPAWYDFIIDRNLGSMQARNRGAKTILRQLRRDLGR